MTLTDAYHLLVARSVRRIGVEQRFVEVQSEGRAHRLHVLVGKSRSLRALAGRPKVVLLHGLGSSSSSWVRIFPALLRAFPEVHAIDMPGAGLSPEPDAPLLAEPLARIAGAYIEQFTGPALVIGNSLGGALAMGLASERPDLARALVLVAPAGARLTEPAFEALVRRFDLTNPIASVRLVRSLFHTPPLWTVLLAPLIARMIWRKRAVRHILDRSSCADCVDEARLAKLTMPTLLLWGEGEDLLPAESLDYFRRNLPPTAVIEVVSGFGHIPQLEAPRRLAARILDFAGSIALEKSDALRASK